jgi:hypothetical protein
MHCIAGILKDDVNVLDVNVVARVARRYRLEYSNVVIKSGGWTVAI